MPYKGTDSRRTIYSIVMLPLGSLLARLPFEDYLVRGGAVLLFGQPL